MDTITKLTKAIMKASRRGGKSQPVPAFLGDSSGTVATGVPGYAYARLYSGETIEIFNGRVANIPNLPVLIGIENSMPGILQVLSARDVYAEAGVFNLPDHAPNHQWPGHDTVWVEGQQIMPLLVQPSSGFIVQIYEGYLSTPTGFIHVLEQTVDLSASQPASGALYVLLQVDGAGMVTAKAGSTVAVKELLTAADIPLPDADNYPIAAVRLYDGQEEILCNAQINDIVDLRFGGYATAGGAGFDLAAEIHAADASAISDEDEMGFWENVANALRKITWANIKATLKTYFDTLYPHKWLGKTTAPTINDDSGDGYAVGDLWLDETNDKEYVALDVTVGAAVWIEVGAGIAIVDTEANILASTEDVGKIALSTDIGKQRLFLSLGGGSWMVSPFDLVAKPQNPDMGYEKNSSRIGYGTDYITDKRLSNVLIGGNVREENGAIRVDVTQAPDTFEIYLREMWNTIIYDLTIADGDFRHTPIGEQIYVWRGDSVMVGLNGQPVVQEYQVSMGAYPGYRIIDGGTF